jgi:hypothetical protein
MKKLGKTVVFYLPTADNNGEELSGENAKIKNKLLKTFEGVTEYGSARGIWKDGNGPDAKIYHDDLTLIEVSGDKTFEEIEALAIQIRETLRQEALYFKIDGAAYLA